MNRAGKYVNNMPGDTSYQSFCPNPLPPVPGLEFDEDMLQILVKASRSLKQLDVSAQLIPNAELFISMYVRKEALMSSQMEGTQCTLDDILDPELDTNANLDTADVVNYVKAAQYALQGFMNFLFVTVFSVKLMLFCWKASVGRKRTPENFDAHRIGLALPVAA